MKGTSLVLQGFDNFKKSDKCLRIELGKESNLETRRQIMNNLSVNCFENDQDEGKAWKWISQGLSEGDYMDETLLKFLSNQTDDLEIPNDDYFDGLVEKLKGLDIGILLQNICEQLVTKQIPKDVQTSFWTKLTLKFLEK